MRNDLRIVGFRKGGNLFRPGDAAAQAHAWPEIFNASPRREGLELVHRGATVKDFTPEEVEQIYDIRQLLEAHAAKIMPLPANATVIEELKAAYAKHSDAVDAHQTHMIFRSNLKFHRILFNACGNPFLAKQIDQLASRVHAVRFISDDRMLERAKDAREDHAKVMNTCKVVTVRS